MRKEVSIAVIIGIILGSIILYGIKLANQTSNSLPKPSPTPTAILPTDVKPQTKNSTGAKKLSITSHVPNQVLFEKEITISGNIDPNVKLAIVWEEDEAISESDTNGTFSQKITLIPGENIIQIDYPDQNSTLSSQTIKLYYSTKTIE